jgi:hypothetical protein
MRDSDYTAHQKSLRNKYGAGSTGAFTVCIILLALAYYFRHDNTVMYGMAIGGARYAYF